MRQNSGVFIATALLLAAGASPMLAQVLAHNSTSTTTPTFHVDSKLVVLDVVVTDAKGNIVPGLKREDFTVLQDNISMPIRTFESWTDRKPLPEVPALDRFNRPDWGETPLTIFVLDELNTPFDEKTYSAVQLKKYLKAQPVLLAGPATLIVVNDYGYHSLQDYTRNRDLLIARLDARPPAIPSKLTIGENDLLLRQSFALLRQIAISSQGLREHKNLVWIGRGFPSLDPTGLTDASQASLQNAIRNTVSLLQDARVTVYKVDPMATTTQLTTVDQAATLDVTDGAIGDTGDQQAAGEDPFAQNFNFNTFAVATGGHYFYGLNDLNRFIDTSVQQGTEFYTLSYRPPPATVDGTFLNIKIMMIPPGLTAQTRQGYYASLAAKPEPTSDELGFDLGQAAVSQMEYAGVNASVSSIEPSKVPGRLRVTFKIEDRTLQWSPATNGRVSDFTTVLVALDAKHQIVSSNAYKMHPFMVDSDSALLTTGLLTVADDVRIDPKTRFVRVLVRDSSGRIGSADVDGVQLQAAMAKIVLPSEKRFGRH